MNEEQLYKDFQKCCTIFNEKMKGVSEDSKAVKIILEQIASLDETDMNNSNYLFLLKTELIKRSKK
jgi:arabinogalactan endo-1,4-beta-galactosidase